MTAIRTEGKINQNTIMIDAGIGEFTGSLAVFLIQGKVGKEGQKILIDAGTKDAAVNIYNKVKKLGAWPVDSIILTHSHFDHSQGVVFLRNKASEVGHNIKIFASNVGIPFLKDQSYNKCFTSFSDQEPYLNIDGVEPLKHGDIFPVDSETQLKIIETPGHMIDHICIFDEKNKTVFAGDSIGVKKADRYLTCNANNPYFSESGYYNTLDELKKLNFEYICLSHFGCINGEEAKNILDESKDIFKRWWEIFNENIAKLDDLPFIENLLWERVYNHKSAKFREDASEGLRNSIFMSVNSFKDRMKIN